MELLLCVNRAVSATPWPVVSLIVAAMLRCRERRKGSASGHLPTIVDVHRSGI
jgi:hypothetical protein